MLQDIKRIMQPDAKLYIMEPFFKQPATKEKNCKQPYMLKPEFLALMKESGFELVSETLLDEDKISEDTIKEHPNYENMTGSFFEFKSNRSNKQ